MRIPPHLAARGIESIVGLDFETCWDKDYTLKKMSTTDYVRDPRFKAQCVGLRSHASATAVWRPAEDVADAVAAIDWSKTALLAHHAHFDGSILTHHYGHRPAYYLCTLSMARPLHGGEIRNDLDTLSRHYNGRGKHKGYLKDTKGVVDLSVALMALLGEGCAQDVDEMWRIFECMLPHYPEDELDLIHHTVRAYVEPVLHVDQRVARVAHKLEVRRKRRLLARVALPDTVLRSRPKFAAELEKLGVTPPMKVSPKTGELTHAFAKDDLEFQALLEHTDARVRDLVEARLAVSTSLEETRALRLLSHAEPALPIYLNYGKAHTLRWSGGDKSNPQNFGRQSLLRRALLAPPGHKLVIVDSAQIEARMNAWLAGEDELVEAFRDTKRDFYKEFAAESIFGCSLEEIDKTKRFCGKVCIAEDAPVLTNRGWVPIQNVASTDLVWDGIEWVQHKGLIHQGVKQVWMSHSVGATPDHEILTERGWRAWSEVLRDPGIFQSALSSASLPLFATNSTVPRPGNGGGIAPSVDVLAEQRTSFTSPRLKTAAQPDATNALSGKPTPNGFGSTETQCATMSHAPVFLTGSPRASAVATEQPTNTTSTTANGESPSTQSGVGIAQSFSATFRRCLAGIIRRSKWIVPMLMETTTRVTSGSLLAQSICPTNAKSLTCSAASSISKRSVPTFDLACSGPRNRFTIWTDSGPLIVHNCILGLGYQMGRAKFQFTLESGKMGMAVTLPEEMYAATVFAYRNRFGAIKDQWGTMQEMLAVMFEGRECVEYGPLTFEKGRVRLPNGMYLRYPHLKPDSVQRIGGCSGGGMFKTRPAKTIYRDWTYNDKFHIYGGKLTENVVQALARCVVAEQILSVADKHRVVLMVHDEVVLCVPEDRAEQALKDTLEAFHTPRPWCLDLPVAGEGKISDFYAKG